MNSTDELIQKATMIGHQLSMAEKPVAEDDLVLHVLRAPPHEYNAFKTSIATRSDPLSLTDLYREDEEEVVGEREVTSEAEDASLLLRRRFTRGSSILLKQQQGSLVESGKSKNKERRKKKKSRV
ncbi:hypothetical protein EJ110_NYTH19181 [Nymphaea thermarum]|nr:hypothetical protein EJ110_NYTH19181 [Nymphaea thermarum]